jgi:hypothetical protein
MSDHSLEDSEPSPEYTPEQRDALDRYLIGEGPYPFSLASKPEPILEREAEKSRSSPDILEKLPSALNGDAAEQGKTIEPQESEAKSRKANPLYVQGPQQEASAAGLDPEPPLRDGKLGGNGGIAQINWGEILRFPQILQAHTHKRQFTQLIPYWPNFTILQRPKLKVRIVIS